jgi:DNA repair exonuclease SbcCD ATPase subunit
MSNPKAQLDAAVAKLAVANARAKQAAKAAQRADDALTHAYEAQAVLRRVAQAVQAEAHGRVAGVVTRCLAAVYDGSYEFVIEFVEKRGKTEAQAVFKRDGNVYDPLEDCEGGAVDIAAFALRLAALGSRKPALRKLVVIDEPFRFVDANARKRVGALLEMLCQEGGLQIVMATHHDELKIGKVVQL